jgi:glyoxylase-like metal-dependent hydrolase (beta-lactamase superfamily II)
MWEIGCRAAKAAAPVVASIPADARMRNCFGRWKFRALIRPIGPEVCCVLHLKRLVIPLLGLLPTGVAAEQVFPMRATQVAPGIYAVITPAREFPNPDNRGWNSNSAFVVTDSGVVLFDTGSSTEIGKALKRTIATVTDKPVRWIVNSHAHGDHWLGNAAFADSVETIFASSTVRERIKLDGPTWVERFQRMTDGATGNSPIALPTATINQRTERVWGNTRFVIFPSGNSHSPGDLLVWLPEARVLLSGDVVYSDRMPSTNASDLKQWISLLGELQRLQPRVVIPGHGRVTDVNGIARLQALLQGLWQSVEKGYAAGKAPYEIVPDVSQALAGFRADFPGMEEKLKRDIPRVYLQVEAANF